jgi:hypothetical protein
LVACVGGTADAAVEGFGASSTVEGFGASSDVFGFDFVVLVDRASGVLPVVALVALAALLLAGGTAGATVATRVLAIAELVLVLLVLVLLLLTAVLATTAPSARAALVGFVELAAGVACPAPEADCALGIDQIGPNTTATAMNVDSPACSHLRCASLVNNTRGPACMPISPLATRTDAGVSYAAFGHDLNG